MLQALMGAGLPKDHSKLLLLILGHFKAGYAEHVTNAVQKITGQAPRGFEGYAEDYRGTWESAIGVTN